MGNIFNSMLFKYAIVVILLIAIFLTIDIWQLDRVEKIVTNTLESAEQAAIIKAMDAKSLMFVERQEIGFDKSAAEQAFIEELQRGLKLDKNLRPTGKWLKEFKLGYLYIDMYNGRPIVTAGVEAKTKLLVAPLIGYASETVRVQLADRHLVVWK